LGNLKIPKPVDNNNNNNNNNNFKIFNFLVVFKRMENLVMREKPIFGSTSSTHNTRSEIGIL
jgi:hypothetical protein